MFELWGFQNEAVNDLRQAIHLGCRRPLLVAPTGSGKTVIAAQIVKSAASKNRRVMFLAHRRELVNQCADKLIKFGVDHGIIMSGEELYGSADCQVASIDTLRARCIQTNKLPLPHADVIIIDEAHRSLAATYLKIIEAYPNAIILGLTATPIRSDGKGLAHVYDNMVQCPSIQKLTELGHLVPARTFAPTIPDLTGIKITKGDYDPSELAVAMNRRSLVGDVIQHWHRLASDRPTVVFASGVKHSIHLRDEFLRQGVAAAHVDGDTPIVERKDVISDLNVGKVQVVCNYGVFTEGFDEPKLAACVLARPTKNLGLYLQMAGRTLRPADDKKDSLIIDHSGCVYEHGFVSDERGWILSAGRALSSTKAKRQEEFDEKKPITCVKCMTVYSRQLPCPNCGHIPEKRGRFVESRSGDLMEVRAESRRTAKARKFTPEQREMWYRSLLRIGINKPKVTKVYGWAAHRYKKKFDEWPEDWFSKEALSDPLPEVKSWQRGNDIRYAKAMEKQKNENDNKTSGAR
jgi:superfamily II DNA or RNA helicase